LAMEDHVQLLSHNRFFILYQGRMKNNESQISVPRTAFS
jgi:hypothetical protein